MTDAALSETPAARAKPAGLKALIQSLLINILGPYIVFTLAEPHFPANSTTPLLLSALVPAIEFTILYWRQRVVDVIAIISLIQLTGSVAITLVADTAHGAIIGHALMPAAEGLVFLASILMGQPMLKPLSRQTMAGNDRERQARFDAVSKQEGAHRVFVRLTWVWVVALCLNSAILLAAAYTLSNATYVLVSTIITYGILALLIWGGIRYGRRAVIQSMGLNGFAPAPHP
jgi:hypothetical protein